VQNMCHQLHTRARRRKHITNAVGHNYHLVCTDNVNDQDLMKLVTVCLDQKPLPNTPV
jgi:hypothetical protein